MSIPDSIVPTCAGSQYPTFKLGLVCILLLCNVQIKTALIKTGMFEDAMPCHLASGLGAGFFAVICGSPVDVVKSRLMGTLSSSCNHP